MNNAAVRCRSCKYNFIAMICNNRWDWDLVRFLHRHLRSKRRIPAMDTDLVSSRSTLFRRMHSSVRWLDSPHSRNWWIAANSTSRCSKHPRNALLRYLDKPETQSAIVVISKIILINQESIIIFSSVKSANAIHPLVSKTTENATMCTMNNNKVNGNE